MTREILLMLLFVSIVVFPWQSVTGVFRHMAGMFRRKRNEQPAVRGEFDPLATKPERKKTYDLDKMAA